MEKNNLKNNENKKMFTRPFSFNGRIRGLEYGLSYIVYTVLHSMLMGLFSMNLSGFVYIILLLLLIPVGWFILAQGAKRCHDRGNSGWYQIIPFYILVMLFGDGDDFDNGYGPDPKGRNSMAELGL